MNAASFSTPLGRCEIAWSDAGLTRFSLPDPTSNSDSESDSPPDWVAEIIGRVQRHFDGDLQDFSDVRFDFSVVSPFQRSVYEAALTVKAGTTRSYGWLASTVGRSLSASRAIGTALGRNPWLLLVPCHRFISASGKLTGFSAPGGIETKLRLLTLERAELMLVR